MNEYEEVTKRMDNIEKINRDNSLAIKELTANVNNLTESTQGMVNVWSAGKTFTAVIKWLSGFSAIAIIVAWLSGKVG